VSDPHQLSGDDLEASIGAPERAALGNVAQRLIHERPAPRAAFRAELRAHLRELASDGLQRPRPAWLWQRVAILVVSGGGLLGLVGLGLSGAGPFAP
jgi:hypothetical protein